MTDHIQSEQLELPLIPDNEPNGTPTDIWECEAQNCKGWMRKSFSLDSTPDCPLCQSPMRSGTRMIPKLKKEIRSKGINFARRNKH